MPDTESRVLPEGLYGGADLRVGDQVVTSEVCISADLIDSFVGVSGDDFEIHLSEEAGRRHGFEGRVAHGLLVLSAVDGLKNNAAAKFKTQASLGWDWEFSGPVLAGDSIHETITVAGIKPTSAGDRAVLTLEFDVRNQRDETVQRGRNKLMVYM